MESRFLYLSHSHQLLLWLTDLRVHCASVAKHLSEQCWSSTTPFTSAPAATNAFIHSKWPLAVHLSRAAITVGMFSLQSLQTPSTVMYSPHGSQTPPATRSLAPHGSQTPPASHRQTSSVLPILSMLQSGNSNIQFVVHVPLGCARFAEIMQHVRKLRV